MWCLLRVDEGGDNLGQRRITRDHLHHFFSWDGVRSGAAAGIDRHSINDLISHLGSESTEADVGRLMIAASSRASRPVNFERAMRRTKTLLQRLGQFESALFGLDLREVAEIRSHARHQPAQEWGWRTREFLQQR